MHNQPKYLPLRAVDFETDQPSERWLPEGTIARGHLNADVAFYTGKINGVDVTEFPFQITEEDMRTGKARYETYCVPCHSPLGDGRGMIVRRGFQQPPTYHDERLRTYAIGHFYDVITNGFGAMPDYASQIPSVRDRWDIAAYIRALQLSQHATVADVPADEVSKLGPTPPVQGELGGAQVTPPRKIAHPNSRGQVQK